MKSSFQLKINLMVISFISFLFSNSALAKSVYAITDHQDSTLKAYKIVGDQLQYQADVNDIRAESVVPVRLELDEIVVKELLEFLDKIWVNGEFDKYVSEKDYLAFRAAIEDFWR